MAGNTMGYKFYFFSLHGVIHTKSITEHSAPSYELHTQIPVHGNGTHRVLQVDHRLFCFFSR